MRHKKCLLSTDVSQIPGIIYYDNRLFFHIKYNNDNIYYCPDKKQILGVINFNSLGSYIRKKVQNINIWQKFVLCLSTRVILYL